MDVLENINKQCLSKHSKKDLKDGNSMSYNYFNFVTCCVRSVVPPLILEAALDGRE